jgi:Secretion system C-terminal sorting domain
MEKLNLYLKSFLLTVCCLLAFSTANVQAQCSSSPPECQTNMVLGHGWSACKAKIYCSNSGSTESGLITCTPAADTDGCGIDASEDAISDLELIEYANADATTTGFFSSGTCNTGNYLQWMVLATPPLVNGTKVQAVGAVDSWWLFHAGSFTIPGDYPNVKTALADPARCNNFNTTNLIICSDDNQFEQWINPNAVIGADVYNVYYVAMFYDAPTNGSLNFKVKECASCPEPLNCNDGNCNTDDSYDSATCACINTPIPQPDCDDDDCNTDDSYDAANCVCVNTPIPPPNCNDGNCNTDDSYDAANCVCVNTPIPPPNCDPTVVCDGNGNLSHQVYNPTTCSCVTVPDPIPSCNGNIVCDGNGNLSHQVYNHATCSCVTVPDPTPTCNGNVVCDGNGNLSHQVYNPATCSCVTVQDPIPTCNGNIVCDGNGNLSHQVYNPATCSCVTVPDPIPTCNGNVVCDGNGNLSHQVYNPVTCSCVTVPDPIPACNDNNCATMDAYNPTNCQCVYTPCEVFCTLTQGAWGNTGGNYPWLNGGTISTPNLISTLMSNNGPVIIGNASGIPNGSCGKSLKVQSWQCIIELLPSAGGPVPLKGSGIVGAPTTCNAAGEPQNAQRRLKNNLATNAISLQLNLWYSAAMGKNLGAYTLPGCSNINPAQWVNLGYPATVQGLMNFANDVLGGCYGPYNNAAAQQLASNATGYITAVNEFWDECEIHCSGQNPLRINEDEEVLLEARVRESGVLLRPNPVASQDVELLIYVEEAQNYAIKVVNVSGKVFVDDRVAFEDGLNSYIIKNAPLANGVYFVTIQNQEGDTFIQKFVKTNED